MLRLSHHTLFPRALCTAAAAVSSTASASLSLRGREPLYYYPATQYQRRLSSQKVGAGGFGGGTSVPGDNKGKDHGRGTSGSSLPRGAAPAPLLGVTTITARNINEEMNTAVPLFLYFTVSNHPDVCGYSDRVIHQVDLVNRRMQHDDLGEAYQESGKDAGLAIKLGVVDCLQEPSLTKKFNIDPHAFPVIYFVRKGALVDRLTGIVEESQVKEAVEAFIEYAKNEAKNERDGTGPFQKVNMTDNDDENPMTLLHAAHGKMQSKDLFKAKELYSKALAMSRAELALVNQRYGVGRRKMDAATSQRLRRERCYNTTPQAMCGLAMCALAEKNREEALKQAAEVRTEFPFAIKDMRDVAEAVVRIEMVAVADFDPDRDSYVTLLKYDELVSNPVEFYRHHLKLAVALFIEDSRGQAIEECLRLIRAEPKLLPALKEAGLLAADLELGPRAVTPARQVIRLLFEVLGETNEHVIKGRQLLQLYT